MSLQPSALHQETFPNPGYKENQLLTRAQAAELLMVSLTTLTSLMNAGELPVVRFGRAVRFRRSSLDLMIKGREAKVKPSPSRGK